MPKVNLGADKVAERLVALIWGTILVQETTVKDTAKKCGMCYTTLLNRRNDPRRLTVEELFRICNTLDIPLDDLEHALFGGAKGANKK